MPVNKWHTALLAPNGELYVSGANGKGQLGTGDLERVHTFTLLNTPIPFTSVAAGGSSHTVAVGADGTLWGWGNNSTGQIGLGTTDLTTTPTLIPANVLFQSVSAGDDFSLALDREGTVWGFGLNEKGQLGVGDTEPRFTPTKTLFTNIQMISTGLQHSLALDLEGNIWGAGDGSKGQLGDSTCQNSSIPLSKSNLANIREIASGFWHNLALSYNDEVFGFGSDFYGQLAGKSLGADKIIAPGKNIHGLHEGPHAMNVWCGGYCSFIKFFDGSYHAFGSDEHKELGFKKKPVSKSVCPSFRNRGLQDLDLLVAGANFTIFANKAGFLFVCGNNAVGQLGLNPPVESHAIIRLPDFQIKPTTINIKAARV